MRGVVVAISLHASAGGVVPRARIARRAMTGRPPLSHRSPGRPKARLRGEKSLAFDGAMIVAPFRTCNAIPALNPPISVRAGTDLVNFGLTWVRSGRGD